MRNGAAVAAFALVSGLGLVAAAADDDAAGPRTVVAVRLAPEESVELDGRLDEPVWRRARPATDFLQQEPREGAPASERTEVRIAYDARNLYLGARLFDAEPERVLGFQKQRDAPLRSDDRFMWILDTFLDGRTAYFFEINPAGLMGDGLLRVGSGRALNKSWDGIWDARVVRDREGWSAEIRIPFRTLSFDPDRPVWGINFQRTVRRKNEESLWSGHGLNEGLFRPIHAGRLVGLEGLSQGLGLEATPYGALTWRRDAASGTAWPRDAGLDLSYNLTPSLRAAFTLNTDFAEVEVDERRVNLTRFPLFFPEKRDFFLEDSSVYAFARANGVTPYFSRRIGLVDGRPIPIVYGARLGGRAGPYDLGLLQIRTGREGEVAPEDFTVARLKRNFFSQSSLGVLYTRRATHADETAGTAGGETLGVDLDLSTSRFLGDKNLQFEAFWVWVSDPVGDGRLGFLDRSARGVRLNFPNDRWQGHVSFRELGDGYDPAVGFVPRNGFRRVQPSLSFRPRPASPWIRQLELGVFFEHLTDFDNRLLTQNLRFVPLGIRFESGDEIRVEAGTRFERLDEPFAIAEGVVLAPGDYRFEELELGAETADHRRATAEVNLRLGEFWSGRRTALETRVTLRPATGVNVTAEWETNRVRLPEGAFTTRLARLEGRWDLSPWSTVTTIVQYDNVSDVLGLYARLRWILRPGSDLFVVYTHNWVEEPTGRWSTLERAATTKLNYAHRF